MSEFSPKHAEPTAISGLFIVDVKTKTEASVMNYLPNQVDGVPVVCAFVKARVRDGSGADS